MEQMPYQPELDTTMVPQATTTQVVSIVTGGPGCRF